MTMKNNSLSPFVDFSTKHDPSDVNLVERKWYKVGDNYGSVAMAQIVKMKVEKGVCMVYYRVRAHKRYFWSMNSYRAGCETLETFRTRLLDLGSVPAINLQPK